MDEANVIAIEFAKLLDPVARRRAIREAQVRKQFRDREHARQVWDDWDGLSPEGEDAHYYLNLIGDGKYCAV